MIHHQVQLYAALPSQRYIYIYVQAVTSYLERYWLDIM